MHDDDFDAPIPDFDDLLEEFNQLVLGIASWADRIRENLQSIYAFVLEGGEDDDDGTSGIYVPLEPAPNPHDHDGLGLSVARHGARRHVGATVTPLTTVPFEPDDARTRAANAGWDA